MTLSVEISVKLSIPLLFRIRVFFTFYNLFANAKEKTKCGKRMMNSYRLNIRKEHL